MGNIKLNPLSFPLWWYTTGLKIAWRHFIEDSGYMLRQTSLIFFLRHINEPFYKDYTRSGRFLGYFFRIIMVVFKTLVFLLRLALNAVVLLLYIVALPAVILMIIYQIFPFRF